MSTKWTNRDISFLFAIFFFSFDFNLICAVNIICFGDRYTYLCELICECCTFHFLSHHSFTSYLDLWWVGDVCQTVVHRVEWQAMRHTYMMSNGNFLVVVFSSSTIDCSICKCRSDVQWVTAILRYQIRRTLIRIISLTHIYAHVYVYADCVDICTHVHFSTKCLTIRDW